MTADELALLEKTLRRREEAARLARAARDDAIRAARAEKMGVREIARLLDIDPSQVTRICQRRGAS